jgi:hypothetical protein
MIRRSLLLMLTALLLLGTLPVLAQEDLTETYSDDFITFNYPSDWYTCGCPDTENALAIGNTEDAPNTDDLGRDEVQVLVVKSMVIWIKETLDVEMEAETPEEVLEMYFAGEDIETYDFNGREAAAMLVENEEARLESLFVTVELGDGEIGMLVATARRRDLDQFVDTVMAIAETFVASDRDDDNGNQEARGQGLGGGRRSEDNEEDHDETDIELSEEFEMEDGDLALNFPEGWQIGEDDGLIILVNDDGALDIEDLSDLRRGEVLVFIYPSVDNLNDYSFGIDDSTRPSTIVSFYASMAMATGFVQDEAMQEPRIGRQEASSVLSVLEDEYEQYVLAVENGDGDIITLFAYGAPGELEDFIPTLEAIASTYEVR